MTCSEELCDRKVYSRGMCQKHYTRSWRRLRNTDKKYVRPEPVNTCHPERKHYAKGFCRTCYKRKGKGLKSPNVNTCHPEEKYHAKGLCKPCYHQRGKKRKAPQVAQCHPELKHKSKGLCVPCYDRKRRNPLGYQILEELEQSEWLTIPELASMLKLQTSEVIAAIKRMRRGDLLEQRT